MICKRLTFVLSALCLMLSVGMLNAQTFNGSTINTFGNSTIPSSGTGGCGVEPQTAATQGTRFNNTVAGLPANSIVASVSMNFTHTFDADLFIFLRAPNGQLLELSTGNGGAGDNYTNTVFSDGAATSITAGVAPFTGTFRPEGTLTADVCGTTYTPTVTTLGAFAATQNGTWQLVISDQAGGDIGTMLGWSITFGQPCTFNAADPLTTLTFNGLNPAICGIVNQAVTAPTHQCTGVLMSVALDGVTIGTVASGGTFNITAALGTHTLVYTLTSGGFTFTRTQTVIVGDGVLPTVTCPGNITINLDPGACSSIVNYSIGVTDNCPFFGPVVTSQVHGSAAANQNNFATITFGIQNVSTAPIKITGVNANLGGFPGPGFAGTVVTNLLLGPINGLGGLTGTNNIGAWTGVGAQNIAVNVATYFQTTFVPIPAASQFVLLPGQSRGIAVQSTNGNFMRYANGNQTTTNGTLSIISNGHWAGGAVAVLGNTPRLFKGSVTYQTVSDPTPVQTSGLASGSAFPIGTTTNCFTANDAAGNPGTCCFSVTVLEFPNPVTSLTCNDLVYFSVDENCGGCVNADDVLEGGPYHCYDDYIVELDRTPPYGNGPWTPACAGPADIGHTYQVRVTDPETGNKCWGNIKFEDKLPPVLKCTDIAIPCNADPLFPNGLPPEPSPALIGYQKITLTPNETIGAPNQPVPDIHVYTFPYGYLPAGTPVQDINVRIKLTQHTFLPDLSMKLKAPNGFEATFMTIGGCTGQQWPIDATFDDAGATITLCLNLNAGGAALKPLLGGVSQANLLAAFNGLNASGNWVVTIADNFAGDQGLIEIVGLEILVNIPQVLASDNCNLTNLTFVDSEVNGGCAAGYSKIINRKWTATDGSGNTSTCIQHITLTLPTLSDLTTPPDYDGFDAPFFLCTDNAYPTPQWIEGLGLQGYPYVFGEPVGCTINWGYEDLKIEVCDGTYKIRRKWSIIDWCIGDGFEFNQIIKVVDNQGPSFDCPANLTVSTDPFSCCATTDLPDAIITDNCSRINNISGMVITFDPFTGDQTGMYTFGGTLTTFPGNNYWNLDTLGRFGYTPCLPVGTHTVIYTAEDDCGNTSTCSFRLTVRDLVPPVAACDEFTVVAIGIDDPFDCYGPAGNGGSPAALGACEFAGVTWVKATTFDDGSYDNCNSVKFTVRRMAPYSDCILGLNPINGTPACDDIFPDFPSEFERAISEYDSIKFYCCEVGTIQTVILRVYQIDINGNFSIGLDGTPIYNECMVNISVQDKIKPVCLPPAHVTVSCENFDPSLWVYGKPTVYDNCCLDTSKVYQGQCGLTHTVNYSLFDTVCNKGTIVRTFRAFDCHGFSSQCTQRVVVNYNQNYFVKFPNDVIVTVCDGTGNYGEPFFFGKDCELLGVNYEDQVFTVVPDACYKIERTWTIINWCTYNPNLPCIEVPNPNPNPIANHPSNLPGPTVSACGTLPPWAPTVVKINPTDPIATNYCTFWDANANCYKYKQIIKVIDGQAPTVDCPASPVEFCDLTPNNAQLWNEMYWWDNVIGSHDLCEGPADICITGTDACSGSNINIHYLLFLDLDGDGVMETVINSINTGIAGLGWNNVYFGNAGNPNFSGGTPRSFDERGVPFNQKYGFAIQTTVSGSNKTACVRWNTQQSQNTFVVPELPYGTHKIKWFVEDGCGNQTVCEYTFIVKDCKKPTVVCLNGLSVNIMPTGMITLWASDFLQYTEDNCTPADQLKIAIRKSGTGTGFPVDANGNPITSVTFTCDELGTQLVELWSIDKAGNADFCETYVIVQDNMGNCGPVSGAAQIAGALSTEATNGVSDGAVGITGSGAGIPSFTFTDMSDNQGAYGFNAIPTSSSSTVTPVKDDNPLNGVSTYDLVLISKHILGLAPLNSPYKMIAADANKNNSITTTDIVEFRKLILGIYSELPNNTSWRFVDASYAFPNPSNPFSATFPENKTYANIQASQMDQDFVSVKIGDVNGSAIANATMSADDRSAGTLLFDVQDRAVKAGETFTVNFKAAEKVQGYQFTMNFAGLEVVDVTPGTNMKLENFGIFADAITTSFDGDVQGEFGVTFRASKAGQISDLLKVSSQVTKAEAYSNSNEKLDVAFRFNNGGVSTISGVGFELYQNQPNPFVNKTFIGFHLPVATEATLTIFDETGRMLFTQKGDYAKGYNSIAIDRALLSTTGVMYYKLETATDSASKKMIQTK